MFVLRAQDAEIGGFSFGGFELGFGLGYGFVGGDSGFVERGGELQRFFVDDYGGLEKLLEGILAVKLEVIDGEFALGGEAGIFEIGGAGLGVGHAGTDGVADAAPEIGGPGGVEGEREFVEGNSGLAPGVGV